MDSLLRNSFLTTSKFKNNFMVFIVMSKLFFFSKQLLSQQRSDRGSLTSKIKDAMYYIFGHELPHINSNATPTQITEWKKHPSVKKCYRKLFQKITLGEPDTFMTRIIDKVWQEKKNVAKVKIAYAISICENMLNPNNHYIQVSEKLVKANIIKNLVSFKIEM